MVCKKLAATIEQAIEQILQCQSTYVANDQYKLL